MSVKQSEASTKVSIREIAPGESTLLETIVSWHLETFKESLSASLGRPYVAHFYGRMAAVEGSILLGAFDETGELQGFVGGTLARDLFYDKEHLREVRSSLLRLFWGLRLPVKSLARFGLKWLRCGRIPIGAELLTIIVRPERRGRGVGRALVATLCGYFAENGRNKWSVFTDSAEGYRFYSRMKMKKRAASLFEGEIHA